MRRRRVRFGSGGREAEGLIWVSGNLFWSGLIWVSRVINWRGEESRKNGGMEAKMVTGRYGGGGTGTGRGRREENGGAKFREREREREREGGRDGKYPLQSFSVRSCADL